MKIIFTPNIKTQYFKNPRSSNFKNQQPFLSPSFKSGNDVYSCEIINLAKKYQYVKNPRTYIVEEISGYEYINGGVEKVLRYIQDLKDNQTANSKKLAEIENNIKLKECRGKEIQKQNAEMLEKIAKIQIKNVKDKIKLQKILLCEKRKRQVYSELKAKFLDLYELENKIFPNGIMIKGMDEESEQDDIIKFLRNNNCNVLRLDFDKIPLKNANKEVACCRNCIKNSGKHSILTIDNFAKYMVYNDENSNFINNMKSTLVTCAKDYNMTVLVFESHPEKLDENIIGRHRFQKVIDVSELNTNNLCEFIPIHDGFRMLFDDNEEAAVDLYLGNFGSNQDVLWVDSSDEKKILAVIDRIDKIKKINKFMNTRYIQFPQPKSFEKLDGCYKTYNYSKDSKRIYEKRL